MTERRPSGVSFESWIDQQIREAQERGAFDDLPGAGKPLPGLDQRYDENWWIKQKIESEGLSTEVLLPPGLQLRKEVQRLPETVRGLRSEESVREVVRELNLRIAEFIRIPTGPFVPVRPVNTEDVLRQWRAGLRSDARQPAATAHGGPTEDGGYPARTAPEQQSSVKRPRTARRGRWWRQLARSQRLRGDAGASD